MADNWSDFTDQIIQALSDNITRDYGANLSDVLAKPDNYVDNEDMKRDLLKIQKYVNTYLDSLDSSLKTERENLNKDLKNCDDITNNINSILTNSAKNSTPIITINNFTDSKGDKFTFYIDNFNNSLSDLIKKVSKNSLFIIDNTTKYNDYKIGEWLFVNDIKIYDFVVMLKPNYALDLDSSRAEFDMLFGNAESIIGAYNNDSSTESDSENKNEDTSNTQEVNNDEMNNDKQENSDSEKGIYKDLYEHGYNGDKDTAESANNTESNKTENNINEEEANVKKSPDSTDNPTENLDTSEINDNEENAESETDSDESDEESND
jgi:hypothetical protein